MTLENRDEYTFDVVPVDWLAERDDATVQHQYRRFVGRLGPALGMDDDTWDKTFITQDPAEDREAAAIRLSVIGVTPEQLGRICIYAKHDSLGLISVDPEDSAE